MLELFTIGLMVVMGFLLYGFLTHRTKLYRIKRELVTPELRELMPNYSMEVKPLKYWIKNDLATLEELEEV